MRARRASDRSTLVARIPAVSSEGELPSGEASSIGDAMTMPPLATFVVGPYDLVEEASDGACALVGYSRAELVGLHGSELVPSERQPATAVSLDRMRIGAVTSRDGVLRHKNGTFVPVAVDARVLEGNRLVLEVRLRRDTA